jgi:Lar family restriction alleviation protein
MRQFDLKPCPFCGLSDDLKITDATKILGTYNIIHRCKIVGPIKIETFDEADVAARWNTRAALSLAKSETPQ